MSLLTGVERTARHGVVGPARLVGGRGGGRSLGKSGRRRSATGSWGELLRQRVDVRAARALKQTGGTTRSRAITWINLASHNVPELKAL